MIVVEKKLRRAFQANGLERVFPWNPAKHVVEKADRCVEGVRKPHKVKFLFNDLPCPGKIFVCYLSAPCAALANHHLGLARLYSRGVDKLREGLRFHDALAAAAVCTIAMLVVVPGGDQPLSRVTEQCDQRACVLARNREMV